MRKYFLNLLLLIAALPSFSQSVITYPSSGNIATEEWVQNYLFDQLEKYNISDCDLKIDTIFQDGSAIELGLSVSLPNLTNYSIRIIKGDKSWFWNAVPYTVGERMRIEGVPRLDSVRITIRPTSHPTCYVGFNYNLGGGDNPDPTDPTDPTIRPCDAGPTILAITSPTQTGLTAQFHGNGVTKISWKILSGSSVIRTGEVTPASSFVPITFPAINPGNYTLQFSGVLCTGTSTKTFTVGSTDPEIPVDPDPSDIQPVVNFEGLKAVLNLTITGTSNNWVLNDLSTYPLDSDKTWWYLINGEIVKQRTPLTNYPYQTNAPGRVLKMALKTAYDTFNKWTSDPAQDGYYYDLNAGQTFNYNQSSTYSLFFFQ